MTEELSNTNWPSIYRERRNHIRKAVDDGVVLWLGHVPQARNYADNPYPFRQNSHFLYYTGLSEPDLAVLSFPEPDYDILFSRVVTLDDVVWSGPGKTRIDLAREAGIDTVEDIARLGSYLTKARTQGFNVYYTPPYQATSLFRTAELLVIDPIEAVAGASERLAEAIAAQRSIKSEEELAEIEDALEVTAGMYRTALKMTRPGLAEHEIAGAIQAVALRKDRQQAYLPIVTVHGEVMHNHSYHHTLQGGQLLLIDAGAESPRHYASDITRTFPVSGRFSTQQAEVYQTVLRTQMEAIGLIKPGVPYRDVHLQASRVMVEGLRAMGLMKGDPADAVAAGAHALFFPHGLGHMLGLDVHDMEDLGDVVGYPRNQTRNSQFGLNFLRLSRPLEPGFVLTVEPGIYFIPALIDRWQNERLHRDFINYDALTSFRSFGGIRIEDNVVVTGSGARVLGPGIPKRIPEVEEAMDRSIA
jgi:Xaa-Pro aminopeptidase